MTLTILYFAKARDYSGVSEELLELDSESLSLRELMLRLESRHPALRGSLDKMRVARNESFADLGEHAVHGDVIALIPPVAGG